MSTQRNAPCTCGSGKKYKHCCGAVSPTPPSMGDAPETVAKSDFDANGYLSGRPFGPTKWGQLPGDAPEGLAITKGAVPPGFLIVQNALDEATCAAIVRQCEAITGVRSTVASQADGAGYSRDTARTSDFIDIRQLNHDIPALIRTQYRKWVEPHFGVSVEWCERPEILRYRPGGEFTTHADAEHWDLATNQWSRVKDRDFSLLLYLNQGFTGGEIEFPNFGMKLPPQRGMLVVFPSDGRYLHAARPTQTGVRYALVCWAAVKGGRRMSPNPPPGAFSMDGSSI